MKIQLPQYSGMDNKVMLIVTPLFAIIINAINFGLPYFSSFWYFLTASLITMIGFSIQFVACGAIAVYLKKRIPSDDQLTKRLFLMIVVFLATTGIFLVTVFHLFESIPYYNYQFHEHTFAWSYLALGIINIFLTFLMEGIASYTAWKATCQETEQLNQAYKQSQLQGLKSQVNPHFLFNSLNSLSSLIHEDERRAERFLDEMSKVYRYMLRNDEEQLVTLQTELRFMESYMHLLNARFGDGLRLTIDIADDDQSKLLTPLALHVIIENAYMQNTLSKDKPLVISVTSNANGTLTITHNVRPKTIMGGMDLDEGLDCLIKKYQLMNQRLSVSDTAINDRVIQLALISPKREWP
tara:strand:- start:380 stop:1438 length:1059 start_codon:yes stop_codon:yes gene_type:complete